MTYWNPDKCNINGKYWGLYIYWKQIVIIKLYLKLYIVFNNESLSHWNTSYLTWFLVHL